jgi:hypothetical protein
MLDAVARFKAAKHSSDATRLAVSTHREATKLPLVIRSG